MPANPDDGARLAARIIEAIAQLERYLIKLIVDRLRAGLHTDEWGFAKLAEMQMLRRRLESSTQRMAKDLPEQITRIALDAYNTGQALAVNDLTDIGRDYLLAPDPVQQVERIMGPIIQRIQVAVDQIPTLLLNVYEDAVNAGVSEVLGGTATRVQAAQRVLDELATRGVTGYRDSAGRNWSLESYVEMAVRTGAGHAAVQGHVDALQASGMDLIIVSDAPRECPLCRPWERKVLSISGRVGAIIEPSELTGNPVVVNVAGSLEEARAAGFQHPNCRHSISAYLPGVTIKGTPGQDAVAYEAGQRQREMERKIREWKRRQAVALDDAAARRAGQKVRDWQAALREHVDLHDLQRLRRREQIGTAL
jgi:hypothetical protein